LGTAIVQAIRILAKGVQMKQHQLLAVALTTAGLVAASSEFAATPANAFTLNFDANYGSSNSTPTGASAALEFDFIQDGDNVRLDLGIDNTTDTVSSLYDDVETAGSTEATFMGFAFDLLDGLSVKDFTGNDYFGNWSEDASLPPYGTFDLGVHKNNKLTGGNPRGGLIAGKSTSISFLFETDLSAEDVESGFQSGFSDGSLGSVSRFQSVGDENSQELSDKLKGGIHFDAPVFEAPGSGDDGSNDTSNDDSSTSAPKTSNQSYQSVPEPSALAGLGLIGALVGIRRRQDS
jgi:hypothetical protein